LYIIVFLKKVVNPAPLKRGNIIIKRILKLKVKHGGLRKHEWKDNKWWNVLKKRYFTKKHICRKIKMSVPYKFWRLGFCLLDGREYRKQFIKDLALTNNVQKYLLVVNAFKSFHVLFSTELI